MFVVWFIYLFVDKGHRSLSLLIIVVSYSLYIWFPLSLCASYAFVSIRDTIMCPLITCGKVGIDVLQCCAHLYQWAMKREFYENSVIVYSPFNSFAITTDMSLLSLSPSLSLSLSFSLSPSLLLPLPLSLFLSLSLSPSPSPSLPLPLSLPSFSSSLSPFSFSLFPPERRS